MTRRHLVRALLWLAWTLTLVLVVAALLPSRDALRQTHVAFLLLLVVLGASSTLGFIAGVTIAILASGLLSYYFETPLDTLDIPRNVDLFELCTFLVVAVVAAWLLTLARRRARLAESRAREIEQMAAERLELIEQAANARVLVEAARLKDALLATVSHDLRTPLTTLRSLAERRAADGDTDWRLVEKETQRLSHLVVELLDYSRIRGNALPVRLESHAVEDIIGVVAREADTVVGHGQLQVVVPTEGEILAVRCDAALATRVLMNLIENAVKHGAHPSCVRLTARRNGGVVRFTISNRGPLIPPDARERIFEPFERGPNAGASGAGGVGLGLTIARALAEAQGGTLTLSNASANAMTEFTFEVPVGELPDGTGEPPATAVASAH